MTNKVTDTCAPDVAKVIWRAPALILAAILMLIPLFSPSKGSAAQDSEFLDLLVERLETWLDHNAPYPAVAQRPTIFFVPAWHEVVTSHEASQTRSQGRTRGLYDARTGTIYLVAPWNGSDLRDASVLLHELVHHRQQNARHWYCASEQEWDAYHLQEEWLAGHGIKSDFYWPAIALSASCTPKDIHPD